MVRALRQEMPELTALQKELQPKNVQILGIGIDNPANISAFADKYKIGYPLYVAGMDGTELSRQLGNQAGGLPFTVLIGADGQREKDLPGPAENRGAAPGYRRDVAPLPVLRQHFPCQSSAFSGKMPPTFVI